MVLLYYRFIRLLWVGPSVQPSLRVVFLEEKEKDRDDGNPVVGRAHALCPLLGLRGVWGCAEAGGRGYRTSSPGSVCPWCISGVWMLLPVSSVTWCRDGLLNSTARRTTGMSCFMQKSGLSILSCCLESAKETAPPPPRFLIFDFVLEYSRLTML